jgi:hypothetical protein
MPINSLSEEHDARALVAIVEQARRCPRRGTPVELLRVSRAPAGCGRAERHHGELERAHRAREDDAALVEILLDRAATMRVTPMP